MKSYPAPTIPEVTVIRMRELAGSGISREELIQRMRDAGLSVIPSIRLLSSFFGMTAGEAKSMIHYSKAWSDLRESHDALHRTALETLK